MVSWIKPIASWMKINVDRASRGAMHHRGVACVIRDEEERWIKGAARNLGSCSTMQAKFWGLLQGLELARVEGYKKVIIETNSN